MDNINDLENSSKEQLVEKVESMQEEIDSLKEENSRAKSNLMWKVRKLEKDKVLIENEKIRLERETKSLRSEVERFRSPPLVLATITEVLDDHRMTVKSSTGPSFLVNYSKFLDEKLLVPGSRVALNQQTFGIVEVLPSEKAFAYKMKLEALKHQGKSLSPKGTKSHSVDEIDDTKTQIYRYVRLTYLIPELLQLVDDTVLKDKRAVLTMGLKPAVELSYLTKEEQKLVYMGITYEDLTPSHAQTIEIRKLSKSKKLDFNSLEDILCQKKGNQNDQISFNKDKIESVLPTELLKRDKRYIERYIIKAIIEYKKMKIVEEDELDF